MLEMSAELSEQWHVLTGTEIEAFTLYQRLSNFFSLPASSKVNDR
jgi:hypothetical protein